LPGIQERYLDKVEVWRSSRHGPTTVSNAPATSPLYTYNSIAAGRGMHVLPVLILLFALELIDTYRLIQIALKFGF
jgi:hypothetical protein